MRKRERERGKYVREREREKQAEKGKEWKVTVKRERGVSVFSHAVDKT